MICATVSSICLPTGVDTSAWRLELWTEGGSSMDSLFHLLYWCCMCRQPQGSCYGETPWESLARDRSSWRSQITHDAKAAEAEQLENSQHKWAACKDRMASTVVPVPTQKCSTCGRSFCACIGLISHLWQSFCPLFPWLFSFLFMWLCSPFSHAQTPSELPTIMNWTLICETQVDCITPLPPRWNHYTWNHCTPKSKWSN